MSENYHNTYIVNLIADDDDDDEDSIINSAKALLNSTYDIIIQIYKNNSKIVIKPENLIKKFGAI